MKKICIVENCTRRQQRFRKCKTHGPRCSIEGCKNSMHDYKNKLCQKHNPKYKCKKCHNVTVFFKLGLCRTHGPRCNEKGCDNAVREYGKCAKHSPNRCQFKGCSRPTHKENLCVLHLECPCNKPLVACYEHYPDKSKFCQNDYCQHNILSNQRRKSGIKICKFCDDGLNKLKRIEHTYRDYFNEWGYPPTITDVTIKSDTCETIKEHGSDKSNKKRADYLWLTERSFPYNILVECDENGHSGIDPSCEYKRLQDVYDQIVSNTRNIKQLAVIRFNPFAKYDVIVQVKRVLEYALKGNYTINDDRGFEVVELLGYSRKRKQKYEESGFMKRRII